MNQRSMFNYGPDDFSWELWHEGSVLDRENVVLVHGYRFPLTARRGRCDGQFAELDKLLQIKERQFNVWQFEYVGSSWGTYGSVATYASRLGKALDRVREITSNYKCSIIAYSMGGMIARRYIAMGGKPRVSKLLTLATPHMGTLRFQPFNLRWTKRIYPRAAVETRPDSRLLWDLNSNVDSSSAPDFAALGGYSWGNTDGMIEMGSTSLVKCHPDGSIAENLYFAAVKRSHRDINRIKSDTDEVFQLIRSFLFEGVAGISRLRRAEKPGDYGVPCFLTFSLKEKPRRRTTYPSAVITNTGHRYAGTRVFTQGARTEDGSYIYTVQLRPDDDGEARIYYAPGEYATVHVQRGQSTVVTQPIGAGVITGQATCLLTD